MKNIKRHSIFLQLTLGIFLGMFLFVSGTVGAEEVVTCSALTQTECKNNCRWNEAYTDINGIEHEGVCVVAVEVCRSVNSDALISQADKIQICNANECWWNEDTNTCRPAVGMCEGRRWSGCALDSDCRWYDGECMLRADKQSEKAVEAIMGICKQEPANSQRNKFWIDTIPVSCVQPITNAGVRNFCDQNAEDLTPYGKRKCRDAIGHVISAAQKECLDESEMIYQRSLKDSAARQDRRDRDEACRANVAEVYSGPVFSGGGLRSGAILAHENLTKSISHETDLKSLVLGWTKFVLELVAIIAVLAVVWAGILYITDMGDGGNQEKAKKILIWVAIGILVILGSYAIVNALMTADLGSSRAAIITSLNV